MGGWGVTELFGSSYKVSAEHLASPKPRTNKNCFRTNHFVTQLDPKTIVKIGPGSSN